MSTSQGKQIGGHEGSYHVVVITIEHLSVLFTEPEIEIDRVSVLDLLGCLIA